VKHKESDAVQTVEEIPLALSAVAPGEIVIGTLVAIDKEGQPFVDFSGNVSDHSLKAMATLGLTQTNIGRQVALLFANGNLKNPVIMGMIHSPLQEILERFKQSQVEEQIESKARGRVEQESGLKVDDVRIDGEKITFEAKEKIVLTCGESSIILTKNGKISIRGKNLLNRATGTNQIKGGTIQVN